MKTEVMQEEVPFYGKYDVIVAGGGPSGITAAASAARNGASVLLIEQSGMLGGLGTSGLMTMYIALEGFSGIGMEIFQEVKRASHSSGFREHNDSLFMPYQLEIAKRVYDNLIEDSGASLLLYTKLIGVKRDKRMIRGLFLAGAEGNLYVEADMFVDATGDAILSAKAGVVCEIGDSEGKTQAPTMVGYYANVNKEAYIEFFKNKGNKVKAMHDCIEKAFGEGILSDCDLHHPGAFMIADDMALINAGHIYGADCSTSMGLTEATVLGRRQAHEYSIFYKKYIGGFEYSHLVTTGSSLGVRETRRVVGRYLLNYNDKLHYRKFEDKVGRYPGGPGSDLHASSVSRKAYNDYYNLFTAKDERVPEREPWYEMPFRSLLVNEYDNLLVAGRCASLDRIVNGQLRVMGPCFMMGQAAGTAAGLCCKSVVLTGDLCTPDLQKALVQGGILL